METPEQIHEVHEASTLPRARMEAVLPEVCERYRKVMSISKEEILAHGY